MLEENINKLLSGEDISVSGVDPGELVTYLAKQKQANDNYQEAVMTMAASMAVTLANTLIHTGNIKDVNKFSDVFTQALDKAWEDMTVENNKEVIDDEEESKQ